MVNIGIGFRLDAKENSETESSAIDTAIDENKSNISRFDRVTSGIQGLDEKL